MITNTDAQSWLSLQAHYDTELAREALYDTLAHIQPFKGTLQHNVIN